MAAVALVFAVLAGSALASFAPGSAATTQRVFLLGDSVTAGATPAIRAGAVAHGWVVSIDAKVGRTTTQGAAIARAMRAQLPPVVVVELGNNDGGNPSSYRAAIDAVMSELTGVRRVVWYTITPFAPWVPAANAELRAAAHRWPNLELADWGSVSEQTAGALYAGGPHLRPPGAQAFADLLFSTLGHAGTATSVVPVVGSFSRSRPSFATSAPQSGAVTAIASASHGRDLWFVTPDGRVSARRGTPMFGSLASPPSHTIVGMSATPSGRGYWLVASDGGIFGFGDARFRGSTGGMRLRQPIVGMSATPSGRGYWLVASDGGIFGFGDARFRGSTGGMRLRQPIVGMSATPSGRGYWLLASDGGIFAFGDARFDGSGVTLHSITGASFVGIASDTTGYQLAGFTIGDGT